MRDVLVIQRHTPLQHQAWIQIAPVGAYERDLAISITQNRWRLHRARAMECNIQGLGQHDLADNYATATPEVEVAIAGPKPG